MRYVHITEGSPRARRRAVKAAVIVLLVFFVLGFTCRAEAARGLEGGGGIYASYRDVPGVTEAEIEAVESLLERRDRFVYGAYTSTECFLREDGSVGGFAALLCEWLSGLFGVPFEPRFYDWDQWEEMLDGLASYELDFNGDLTRTPERMKEFYMTEFLSNREIKMFRMAETGASSGAAETRPPRYVFYRGVSTFRQIAPFLKKTYEVVFSSDYDEIHRMLKEGVVDAYFEESSYEAVFDEYGDVVTETFLPLVYEAVSLSTRNPELEPIITVVQKAMEGGAISHLTALNQQGYRDYCKNKLFLTFTPEERAYIDARIQAGEAIPVGLEFDNYPISFFNTTEQAWQGIVPDILAEIESLTGLRFDFGEETNLNWTELTRRLEAGEIALVDEVIQTAERADRFLWPRTSYISDNYTLLTRLDYKDSTMSEFLFRKVGVVRDSGYADMFRRWFPYHPYVTEYSDNLQAIEGLAGGEVDAVMSSKKMLLYASNYLETPDFKINILFPQSIESTFGFNINEAVLCSVTDKAMALIDTGAIAARWEHRGFEYRSAMLRAQRPLLITTLFASLFAVALLFVMYFRSRSVNKHLEAAVADRTRELEEQTEAAISASQAKSDFLAKMSHEIRTPMNTITGMSELILHRELSPDVFEYAVGIRQAGANLLSVINDILDFSKIESGKLEIVSAEYRFASLINDVIAAARMRLTETSLDFVTNIDSALPRMMVGDEVRIRQILVNLLSNAIKYTREGHIVFTVGGNYTPENGRIQLFFEIADTGIGIRQEDMDKLFDDFVQFDAYKNRGIEGAGLGLTIARSLCRAMGGDITVSSVYGEGSVFTAVIPQVVVDAEPSALVKDPEMKHVLVYERREIHANSLVRSVKNLGVQCSLALNRQEFLKAMEKASYSHILTDSVLFGETRDILSSMKVKPALVFRKNYGEPIGHDRSIVMPVHSISIADILNDTRESYSHYDESRVLSVPFTAPSARVLVVDDIATNLKVAADFLALYELQADTCASGAEALCMVQKHRYDVIFMDHMMPGMDGIEATEAIRALPGDYFAQAPIIALTANAISGMREMFLSKGFSDYLSKPIRIQKLKEIMETWIPPEKRVGVKSSVKPDGDSGVKPGAGKEAVGGRRLEIDGVDVARGIQTMGGSEQSYRELLAIFREDVLERLDVLREAPKEEDAQFFVTQVHALKSAAGNIGAMALSADAARLEDAGKRGDAETIRRELDPFREALIRLAEAIRLLSAGGGDRRRGG
jgi:signal transduction histidine kinase/CheY-like chemotaxis protein